MNQRSVTFSDSKGLRWMSALPIYRGGTYYDGDKLDLLEHLETIRESLTLQIREGVHRPSLLINHEDNGINHGVVRDFRILTDVEAKAKGVDQKAPVEVYFGLDVTDPAIAAAYDRGAVVFTSPRLRGSLLGDKYKWSDETGYSWPFFVVELSIVGSPHNKRQTPSDGLREIQMRDKRGGVQMGDLAKVAAMLQQAAAMIAAMAPEESGVGAGMEDGGLAAAVADTVDDVVEETASMESAAMSDRLAKLEGELAKTKAEAIVDAAMRERAFKGVTRDDLVSVAMHDQKSFDLIVKQAPLRPRASERVAKPGTGTIVKGSPEHAARVVAMMDEARKDGRVNASSFVSSMREARARGEA